MTREETIKQLLLEYEFFIKSFRYLIPSPLTSTYQDMYGRILTSDEMKQKKEKKLALITKKIIKVVENKK